MSDLPPVNDASQSSPPARQREVRIVTGARLHFGLLDTVDPFGGIGVMIDRPATELLATPAPQFDYCGPQRSRAIAIANRIAEITGTVGTLPPCRMDVVRATPEHCGLGSGTQLSLAIAEGICRCLGIEVDSSILATRIAARGKRSAVGIHGYFRGGLIFEASSQPRELNDVQQRIELSRNWCVAILRPSIQRELVHGADEVEKFARLAAADPEAKRVLWRIACEELMPAAAAKDFEAFASAIHRFNRASGMLFAAIQGGPYNGSMVNSLIGWLMDRGVVGVGQSSWGPGVFAWFESTDKAEPIIRRLPAGFELIALAQPQNEGRMLREAG